MRTVSGQISLPVAIGFAAFLGLGALFFSNVSTHPPSGRTVVRYCQWSPVVHQPVVWEIKKAFEAENPDIEILLEFYPISNYWTKLLTMIAADVAPDVIHMSAVNVPDYASMGFLDPLDDYIKRDNLDMSQYYSVVQDSFGHRKKCYGLAWQFGNVGLYYNKDLFDQAGVPYPDESWSWTELRAAAKKLTRDIDGDGKTDQFGLLLNNNPEIGWANFVLQGGGQVLNADRTRMLMDSPESIETMQFLADMVLKDKVALFDGAGSGKTMNAAQFFESGRVAMQCAGSWEMLRFNQKTKINYDVTSLPAGPRGNHGVIANGVANSLNAKSKVKEAAWKWIKFYSSEKAQVLLGRMQRGIPVMKRIASSPAFLNPRRPPQHKQIFLTQMQWGHDLYPSLSHAEWFQLMQRQVASAFLGLKPMDQALKDGTAESNVILDAAHQKENLKLKKIGEGSGP